MPIRLSIIAGLSVFYLFAGIAQGQVFVIPPGQEEMIRSLVTPAADGSWPCSLVRTQAGPDLIVAEYNCDDRQVRLVLDHPDRAGDSDLPRTRRFVIRLDEGAPPRLATLVEESVRAAEGEFRWRTITARSREGAPPDDQRQPRFSSPLLTFLRSPVNFAVAVALLAFFFFIVDVKLRVRAARHG